MAFQNLHEQGLVWSATKTQTDNTSLQHLTCACTWIELQLKTACQELTMQISRWRQMRGEKFTKLVPFSTVPTQNKKTHLWRFQSDLKMKGRKVIIAKSSIKVLIYNILIIVDWYQEIKLRVPASWVIVWVLSSPLFC